MAWRRRMLVPCHVEEVRVRVRVMARAMVRVRVRVGVRVSSAVGQLALRRPASAAVHASDCPERWPASVNQPAGAALAGHTGLVSHLKYYTPQVQYGPRRRCSGLRRPRRSSRRGARRTPISCSSSSKSRGLARRSTRRRATNRAWCVSGSSASKTQGVRRWGTLESREFCYR
jgi:hypothetical protein